MPAVTSESPLKSIDRAGVAAATAGVARGAVAAPPTWGWMLVMGTWGFEAPSLLTRRRIKLAFEPGASPARLRVRVEPLSDAPAARLGAWPLLALKNAS